MLRATWNRRIDRRTPMVRMMRATLQMAERRGHPVLVIGTPVPLHLLRRQRWFDEADYRERLGVLRSTAEESGALYLNLHDAFGPDEFRDSTGHFNATGTRRMTDLVEPEIARLLLH
jgi:lysophospholipase L1-like esterase